MAGQWSLRILLDSHSDVTSKLEICRQASHTLNTRRALARSDFDRQKLRLDNLSIFTKEANQIRTSNRLDVDIYRNHSLKKVVKDVKLNAKRRKALAPGAAHKRIKIRFVPKLPPSVRVLGALDDYHRDQSNSLELEKEQAIYSQQLRRTSMLRKAKIAGSSLEMIKSFADDDEDDSSIGTLNTLSSFASKSAATRLREDMNLKLPSLKSRHNIFANEISNKPISLRPPSIDAVNNDCGDDDSSVTSHAARVLRRGNAQMIKNFQLPKPELITNKIRVEKAKNCFSVVDVVRHREKVAESEVEQDVELELERHR